MLVSLVLLAAGLVVVFVLVLAELGAVGSLVLLVTELVAVLVWPVLLVAELVSMFALVMRFQFVAPKMQPASMLLSTLPNTPQTVVASRANTKPARIIRS